jgi:hypothetical protein
VGLFDKTHVAALPGSMWYSYEDDIVLSGWAHLKAIGVPDDVQIGGLSDNDMRSLSGEAFSAPCVAHVLLCYYANPWGRWW